MGRQLRRAQLSAKRRAEAAGIEVPDLPRTPPKHPEVSEHEQRNAARMQGLLIPPSPAERVGLEAKGHRVPNQSGLWLPPR
jgi:RES domain-containing protein